MSGTDTISAFDKARNGLWVSIQKRLANLYEAEKGFKSSLRFTDTFPFAAHTVEYEVMAEYQNQRTRLRDLFVDEVQALGELVKAIKNKSYAADDKKQLFLLILGYADLLWTVCSGLEEYVSTKQPVDAELEEAKASFERVKAFARLNVKGVGGLI
ncbi:hypothetical protein [Solirubrum puertoriconensis]|uniref:Uncharacterized protein n=1 Tax=Solirubrum puertoriconensis TaxID=1751427 RepID=A0A9X0HI85_SOLP1|nr:hypothetical protein [Solirubrum puertoriconensis]KUG06373.1 hypothetical protein ASU33_03175 [Solirubrum puertoriconensis]